MNSIRRLLERHGPWLVIGLYILVVLMACIYGIHAGDKEREKQDHRRRLEMWCIYHQFAPKSCDAVLPPEEELNE